MFQLQSPSAKSLLASLNTSSKCLSKKNAISILDNILLSKTDDTFRFITGTADSQLTIPAPFSLVKGTFTEPVAIPVGEIMPLLAKLTGDVVVNLTFNDDLSLVIDYCLGSDDKVKIGQATITYLKGDEYPIKPSFSADEEITRLAFPTEVFINAVNQAKTFSADDELRPVMAALVIDFADNKECYFVATTGESLIKITHVSSAGESFFLAGTPCTLLVHKQYFRALSVFDGGETVNIESNGRAFRFFTDDIEFICNALEGRFPNYNSVIPRDNPYFFVFDKKEILDTLNRVSIFGSKSTSQVVLKKEGMFCSVTAQDIDFSTKSSEQVFLSDSRCDEGFRIGLSSVKLAEALNAFDSDTIRMQLADPSRAVVLTADEANPVVLALVMPMQIIE